MPQSSSQTASSRRRGPESKADQVQLLYLSDRESGLASALYDALKSLFAEPLLPDNPHYYLASALAAHVDQGPLWKASDASIAAAVDADGGAEVLDAATRLCGLSDCTHAWGLPHVLRLASREGVAVLHDVLANSLPDSFFPGPMPFSAGDGSSVQVLSSVQGTTALWRPRWLEFPELTVRADVVVRGPAPEAALAHFAALLESDLADLVEVPVYFADAFVLVDPAAERGQREGAAPATVTYEQLRAAPEEFRQQLERHVRAGGCVEVRGVVMLDAPEDAQHMESRKLRFESATKRYFLHYVHSDAEGGGRGDGGAGGEVDGARRGGKSGLWGRGRPGARQPALVGTQTLLLKERPTHYGGGAPHEALFEGFFLDAAAARQYAALYTSEAGEPYSQASMEANMARLIDLIEAGLRGGDTLEALRRALLLVLLQDGPPAEPGPLRQSALAPLEDALVLRPRQSEVALVLSAGVNLLRMLNSGAAAISGVVREIEAVRVVARLWPASRLQIVAEAAAAAAGQPAAGRGPPRRSSERRQTAGRVARASTCHEEEVDDTPQARLEWLQGFQMESKLLEQLASLAPRMRASSGSGIFAGISTVMEDLLVQLPVAPPQSPAACEPALAAAAPAALALQHLLEAAALSLADGLLERCRDVAWALHRFGIRLVDPVMARAAQSAPAADGAGVVEWALDVRAATEAQVRAGAVPERVAVEGVMLQYAVDARLDGLLCRAYREFTAPPLAANPFPRLVALVRAHAARLDLWRDDEEELCASKINRLTLLAPPCFIYEARPPPGQSGVAARARGRARLGGAGDDDDEAAAVYGCYAAVTLCDGRALHALHSSLGALLSGRSWQSGAYCAEVIPALVGDAPISNTLQLWDGAGGGGQGEWGGGAPAAGFDAASNSQERPPYEHPRFCGVEAEEHHQVTGPSPRAAAALFARRAAEYAAGLHRGSVHLVHSLDVAAGPADGCGCRCRAACGSSCGGGGCGSGCGYEEQYGWEWAEGGPSFGLGELLEEAGLQAAARALAAAALAQPAGSCVGRLRLFAAVKEGLYVPVTKLLIFQHRGIQGPLEPAGSGGGSADAGCAPAGLGQAGAAAGAPAPRWDAGVFGRVFLARDQALRWWRGWNEARGDPAQPYHCEGFAEAARRRALRLERAGRALDAQKLLLAAATAVADRGAMFHASHCGHSAAQELRALQSANAALAALLSPSAHPQHRAKLDAERARRTFLLHASRLHAALTSPRTCYFSGFAAVGPRLVSQLRRQVLGGGGGWLDAEGAGLLAQLALWTRCCEVSAAAAVQDCLREGVAPGQLLGGGGGGGGVDGDAPNSGGYGFSG